MREQPGALLVCVRGEKAAVGALALVKPLVDIGLGGMGLFPAGVFVMKWANRRVFMMKCISGFRRAIEKEIKNNIETGAYEVLSPQESEKVRREKEDKIVKSRYVLTEKGIEEDDIDKARCEGVLIADDGPSSKKAKARHVMKGFSEENSEYLEVTTPQVARGSVMLTLQILCSWGFPDIWISLRRFTAEIPLTGRSTRNSRWRASQDYKLDNFYN